MAWTDCCGLRGPALWGPHVPHPAGKPSLEGVATERQAHEGACQRLDSG